MLVLLLLLSQSFKQAFGTAVANASTVKEYKAGAVQYIFSMAADPDADDGAEFFLAHGAAQPNNTEAGAAIALPKGANTLHGQAMFGICVPTGVNLSSTADTKIWIGTSNSDGTTYIQIGVTKATPNTAAATAFEQLPIAAGNSANSLYFKGDATNGAITAGAHLFACSATAVNQDSFKAVAATATVAVLKGTVAYTTAEEGTSTATAGANSAWYKVTFADKLNALNAAECVDTANLVWIGAGVTTTSATDALSVKIGTFAGTPIEITSDTSTKVYISTINTVAFTLGSADAASTIIAACADAVSTAPSVLLEVTYAANTAPTYDITQFGSATDKSLNTYDPNNCIAGNILMISNNAGHSFKQIGKLVAKPVATATEFLASAEQAVMLLENADDDPGTTFYIKTIAKASGLIAEDVSGGVITLDTTTEQSKDKKAILIKNASLIGATAGEYVWVGHTSADQDSYVKIGVVSANPTKPVASASLIAAASTATEFYFQGHGTYGAITAGEHMFACNSTDGPLFQNMFNDTNTSATLDVFKGTVAYTTAEEATAVASAGANNAWYKVTFANKLSTMSALCANGNELTWVGGGSATALATTNADLGSVKIADIVTTPASTTASASLDVDVATTTLTGVTFATGTTLTSGTTAVAGCAANTSTAPAVLLKVTYTSSTDTHTVTQFGSVATKTLKQYDPTGCVANNVLLLSTGDGWVQIGALTDSTPASAASMAGPFTAVLALVVSAVIALLF